MAQIDDLRKDFRTVLDSLLREKTMRFRVLSGQRQLDGMAEMDRAISALRNLGEAISAASIEEAPASPPEQLTLIPEDKPYV